MCEYDGHPLGSSDGLAHMCPECEADIEAHNARCRQCRATTNMPEVLDPSALFEALT